MAQPVVRFEVAGGDPARLREYFGLCWLVVMAMGL